MDLSEEESRRRVAAARVARLATVGADAAPLLVPVTFALVDDVLVTAVDGKPKRTANLRRLRDIAGNEQVCVLVDHYHEDWTRLWWVRVDGRAEVLTDGPRHERAVAALAVKYRQYAADPPDGPVIWMAVDRWRGWTGQPTAAG